MKCMCSLILLLGCGLTVTAAAQDSTVSVPTTILSNFEPNELPPSEEAQDSVFSLLGVVFNSPDRLITSGGGTQSENSVAISPLDARVLLNSNNSDVGIADRYVSTDRGVTWPGSALGPNGSNFGDPATAIDRSGLFYVDYIAANLGQAVSYSANGSAWTQVLIASPPAMGDTLDKGHFCTDNRVSSPYSGHLYCGWTLFPHRTPSLPPDAFQVQVSYSSLPGANQSWSVPITISTAAGPFSAHQGVNVRTAPNGHVFAVWAIYDANGVGETGLGFARSTNGGATWVAAQRLPFTGIRGIRVTKLGGGKTMRVNSFPSMTVDSQGVIYVVWTNRGDPSSATAGDPDVYVTSSANEGQGWSTPVRVNQDLAGNGKDQWFPWIAADPLSSTLAVIYYDSRNFSANDRAETFVAVSQNGGVNWEDSKVSDVSWPADGVSGDYAGDYLGIDVKANTVYPVWSDTRTGHILAYTSPFHIPTQWEVPQDFLTLQETVNSVGPGDVVLINTSVSHTGTLTIPNGVALVATDGATPTVNANGAASGVIFADGSDPGTKISGFAITNFSTNGIQFGTSAPTVGAVVENCTIDGVVATSTKTGIAFDRGTLTVQGTRIHNVGRCIQNRATGTTSGALTIHNCELLTEDGIRYRPGVSMSFDNSTLRGVYSTGIFPSQAFYNYGNFASTSVTQCIVTEFYYVFSATNTPCSAGLVVSHNLLNENIVTDCAINQSTNLDGVDPLFCDERDSSVEGSVLRIDSPAFAANNAFNVGIGYFNGEKCAWGTLAHNAIVGSEKVRVLEDTVVPLGKSLTIGAGATIEFDGVDNSGGGVDAGLNELVIDNGTLTVNGVSGNPVVFQSSAPSQAPGDWFGVVVKNNADASLTYCNLKDGAYGLYVQDLGDAVGVTDCNISDFTLTGIHVDNSGPNGVATDLAVSGGSIDVSSGVKGVYLHKAESALVQNVTIVGDNSSWYGVYCDEAPGAGYHYEVNDCTISGFSTGTGVYVKLDAPYLRGNAITGCKWGMQLLGIGRIVVEDNTPTQHEATINSCTTGMYSVSAAAVDGLAITSPSGGTGLYLDQNATGGEFSHLTIANGAVGILNQTTANGSVPKLRSSSVTQFTTNGVKYGVMGLDLGIAGDHGNNNIYSTVSGTGKYVYMKTCPSGGATIPAKYNYWGAATPDAAKFSACVDYTPYLSSQASARMLSPLGADARPVAFDLRVGPNPFRNSVALSFAVPEEGTVANLKIFDVTGRVVRTLVSRELPAAEHKLIWDGRDSAGMNVPTGLYFVLLRVGKQTMTDKLIRIQ